MPTGNPGPVVPERYVAALHGMDPLEAMRKAPKRLKKLVKGLSEKQMARRPEPSKWSIREALSHLADGEMMIGTRYRLVAAMDRPTLVGYDQDAFVERLGIDQARARDLLEDFAAVRSANLRLLARLPIEARARVGLHTERGEESIEAMLVMYAGHDLIHEEQIARAREQLRAGRKKDKASRKEAAKAKADKESEAPQAPKSKQRKKRRGKKDAAGKNGTSKNASRRSPEPDAATELVEA